jgi:hypothetical protein
VAWFDNVGWIEDHLHNRERWIGLRAPVTGTQAADYATLLQFVLVSGNNTWGNAQALLKAADTPYFPGNLRFDFHRCLITANTSNTVYRVRIIWNKDNLGGTGYTVGLANGTYTEFMLIRDSAAITRDIHEIKGLQIPVTWSVWGQCWNVTNMASLDCYFGIHEYDT